MIKRHFGALTLCAAAAGLAVNAVMPVTSALAATPITSPAEALINAINIPYTTFTLKNGLQVVVQTDRRAPVVAVAVWYKVGSGLEPKGKTGFAHLFEHLMFSGSENAPGDFMQSLLGSGVTELNGTTSFDRTNYFATVPTPNLDAVLFLESDRMGHLLGAMTQAKLDNQRGVVQNEKRQGDDRPYGLVQYAKLEGLLPEGHPYHHSTIGSMADLDKASLDDVKAWFKDNYGPNNAVLTLAGDIDIATAKAKVEKWFGAIPRGKDVVQAKVEVPSLPTRKDMVIKDRVAQARIYRYWAVPGGAEPDRIPLDVGAYALGGLANSRLNNALVRDEKLAVNVVSYVDAYKHMSFFEIQVDVKPGVDVDLVSKRLDEMVASYIKTGPNQEEIDRAAMSNAVDYMRALETVGERAVVMTDGLLGRGKLDAFKDELRAFANVSPATATAALQKWLSRPVLALTVLPGEREAYEESKVVGPTAGTGAALPATAPGVSPTMASAASPSTAAAISQAGAPKAEGGAGVGQAVAGSQKIPAFREVADVDFPAVESATLSNGIKVHFARRDVVPFVNVSLSFDAGIASDSAGRLGVQSLMLAAMEQGTKSKNDIELASAKEKLGASLQFRSTMDRTQIDLTALTVNLSPSLDLLADIVMNPAFADQAVARVRDLRLSAIKQELSRPHAIASRTLAATLFGSQHPYGRPSSGNGSAAVVGALKPADLAAFHQAWIRPDKLEIFVVGKTTLAEVKGELEARFGRWRTAAVSAGEKNFAAAIPENKPRVLFVDVPKSSQSVIYGGKVLPVKGSANLLAFTQANKVLGGDYLSRINKDLRQEKGWTYGARSNIYRYKNQVQFAVVAPVQADRTGDAIAELRTLVRDFLRDKGVTEQELHETIGNSIREKPSSFLRSLQIMSQMRNDVLYQRPFHYITTEASNLRSLKVEDLNDAARNLIVNNEFTWVVVGDKAKVLPQLQNLGLPVEVIQSPE
ncbi:pitrilysin family protein [Roseateles sp. SL47]|uniref:M16 family metallopeptidase n=1 Tax=Roseateles sp. SL47 TaxID=2995138 RepID=UPI00226D89D0|nr:pitrilysin family protein [Roseateles sp. SL47]WAC75709.1 pitrilysin family protein [Roseateles sp. SL47]